MYKVMWNHGKAQKLFITEKEAREYSKELREDGEDGVIVFKVRQEKTHGISYDEKKIMGKY